MLAAGRAGRRGRRAGGRRRRARRPCWSGTRPTPGGSEGEADGRAHRSRALPFSGPGARPPLADRRRALERLRRVAATGPPGGPVPGPARAARARQGLEPYDSPDHARRMEPAGTVLLRFELPLFGVSLLEVTPARVPGTGGVLGDGARRRGVRVRPSGKRSRRSRATSSGRLLGSRRFHQVGGGGGSRFRPGVRGRPIFCRLALGVCSPASTPGSERVLSRCLRYWSDPGRRRWRPRSTSGCGDGELVGRTQVGAGGETARRRGVGADRHGRTGTYGRLHGATARAGRASGRRVRDGARGGRADGARGGDRRRRSTSRWRSSPDREPRGDDGARGQ